MTRISDAYSAFVHLRVVVHVHQDQSFRRQDEFSRARMRVLVECRMSCFHDTGATAHRIAVSASVGLHTHSYVVACLCTRELHHEYETRLGGHVHTRASVRLMHGMATYGMSCFGLCLYSFRPHQHHLVSVWRLRHLAFVAATTAKVPSSAVCLPKFVL